MSDSLNNQQKLEEVYHMTLENNQILRSIRKQQHIGNVFRLLYWMVILGALGGVYYYVRPVISTISDNKIKIEDTFKQFELLKSQLPDKKLIDQVINGFGYPKDTTNPPQETGQ